jgi:hypothetical protein
MIGVMHLRIIKLIRRTFYFFFNIQKFLELPLAIDALKNFLRTNRCTAVVLMGYQVNEVTSEILRDLTVFSDGIHKAKQVYFNIYWLF